MHPTRWSARPWLLATLLASVFGCSSPDPTPQAGSGGSSGTGGSGSGGVSGSGGAGSGGTQGGSGGASGSGGSGSGGGSGGAIVDAATDRINDAPTPPSDGPGSNFSFFVTSLEAMRKLSGNQNGFGGDLGGLDGADKICQQIAEMGLPGAGQKTWRAFLSATAGGPGGGPVHAIDRIGPGPWFDRIGRMFAPNKAALVGSPRPTGGNPAVAADMPNELGAGQKQFGDNHDTLTGSNRMGQVQSMTRGDTCNDWTSSVGTSGRPNIGHSWPRNATNLANGGQWIFDHAAAGCAPGVNISTVNGAGPPNSVGGGGGYGGFFCFALTP